MNITLLELAELAQGLVVAGDPSAVVTGFNSIQEAEPGDITFLGNPRYAPALKKSRASAVIAPVGFSEATNGMGVIQSSNPTLAFSAIIQKFGPQPLPFIPGIHASAVISDKAKLDPAKVSVGPHVIIEDDVVIGDGSIIHGGAFIGRGTTMGDGCIVHANAVLKERCLLGHRVIIHSGAVIGTDGFGYQMSGGRHLKIEQVGIVQLDDDVEVGSCTTIDRARFGRTWIGEGSKIDNQVQIAHNVVLGKHCIMVSQVGISGSTVVGNNTTMAGQVGVAGHLKIGDQITILAKSGVTKDIVEPGMYTGYPTRPIMQGRRTLALHAKLPDLFEMIKTLQKRVDELEGGLKPMTADAEAVPTEP